MNNAQSSSGSEAPVFVEDPGRREAEQVGDSPDFSGPSSESSAEGTSQTGEGLLFRFRATGSNVRRSLFRR